MLAAAKDYLQLWQLPIFAIVIFGWLVFGGYFFQKNLKKETGKRKIPLGRGVLLSFLTGLFGGITALVLYRVFWVMLDEPVSIIGMIMGLIGYLGMSYLVVLTLYKKLDPKAVLRVCVLPLAVTVGFSAVVLAPAGIVTYNKRESTIERNQLISKTLGNLKEIFNGLRQKGIDRPPRNLQQLVAEDYVKAEHIKSPANPGREVGFFYIPADILATDRDKQKILACDFKDNFGGELRVVLFSTGKMMNMSEEVFQDHMKNPINKDFAEALKKAEGS